MNYTDIINSLDQLSLSETPCFLINTIAHVPEILNENFDNDSSEEEIDEAFDVNEFENYDIKDTFTKPVLNHNVKEVCGTMKARLKTNYSSTVIKPFLFKLINQGYEQGKTDTPIAACIGLNRMLSLSSRKNYSLILELKCVERTVELQNVFGFFWQCKWFNTKSNKTVKYDVIRKYYKQLKNHDKMYNSQKASQLLKKESDRNIIVPYQDLRNYVKDHDKNRELVEALRQKYESSIVFLTLIDSDTYDFNGIFSAYTRIVKTCLKKYNQIPTVMSTGFEYPSEMRIYKMMSQIDRKIRLIISNHLPKCVYYPEPNMCILIPSDIYFLPESFIDRTRKNGKSESPSLIKQILKNRSQDSLFIFSNDNPLITKVPDRAHYYKNTAYKKEICFSPEAKKIASPTKEDFKKLNQISQCHLHPKVWYDNAFINGAINFTNKLEQYLQDPELEECEQILQNKEKKSEQEIKNELEQYINDPNILKSITRKKTLNHCKHLLAKIRNAQSKTEEKNASDELKLYIDPAIVCKIITLIADLKTNISEFELTYIRSEDETQLYNLLNKLNVNIELFSREVLLIFAQPEVINLIESKTIILEEFINLDIEILKAIFYEADILQHLENETFSIDDILNPFYNKNYSIHYIIDKCLENPFHLKFMTDQDAYTVVLDNSSDIEFVKFGLENYGDEFLEAGGLTEIYIEDILEIIYNGEYTITEIVDRCDENPLHLKFMTGDDIPNIVLDNIENIELVKFALEYYPDDVDLSWIVCELSPSEAQNLCFELNEDPDNYEMNYNYDEY